jgi:hypothetical protein
MATLRRDHRANCDNPAKRGLGTAAARAATARGGTFSMY